MKTNFNFKNEFQFWNNSRIKIQFWKKDFVKKLVFNCNYPAVREHVNHLFLSLHQVSTERNAIPMWWKTEFLQPRSHRKSHIDALWVDMIQNRRVEYLVICSSARSFARITHSLATHWSLCSRAPLRSFARLFCFCIHGDFTWTYTMSSLFFKVKYMQKNCFRFFFAFASTEVPLEDRQCRVRF